MLSSSEGKPGDPMFRAETVDQLHDHLYATKSIWVPKSDGGCSGLRITAIVRSASVNGLPLSFMIRAQRDVNDANKWFGVYVGSPPNEPYPIPLLVIKSLPGLDTAAMCWHDSGGILSGKNDGA